MKQIDIGKAFVRAWSAYTKNFVTLVVGYIVFVLLGYTIVLAPPLFAGYNRIVIKAVKGQSPRIGDVFSELFGIGRYWLAFLLTFGVALVGLIACCIGIIPAIALTLFLFPLMVDKGYPVGKAFTTCIEYFKKEWGMLLLLLLILAGIGFVTAILGNIINTIVAAMLGISISPYMAYGTHMSKMMASMWPYFLMSSIVGVVLGSFINSFVQSLIIAAYDSAFGDVDKVEIAPPPSPIG